MCRHICKRKHTSNTSSNIHFLSAGTAMLDKHKLTAEEANTKPAGRSSGELKALWLSDSSLPCSLLFLKYINCSTELGGIIVIYEIQKK